MKKKLMMVAVLLGALSLGACVDDNESQSVTDLRSAKAEQLRSIAALNNAKAQAEALIAAAEAELRSAEAAYQQALANAADEQTEYLRQKHLLELEKLQAEYEAQIAKAQQEAAYYNQAAWREADAHIKAVFSKYKTAIGEVTRLNGELLDAQFDLANASVDQEQAQAIYDLMVYQQNQIIAENTAKIERLQSIDTDKAALEKQMNDLVTQAYQLITVDKPAADELVTTNSDAFDAVNLTISMPSYFTTIAEELEWENAALPYVLALDALRDLGDEYYASTGYYISFYQTVSEDVKGTEALNPYTNAVTSYALSDGGAYVDATQKMANWLDEQIETQTNSIGKDADDSGLYGTRKTYEDALKTAQDNLKAEQAKETPNQGLIDGYQAAIESANVSIANVDKQIEEANEYLKELQAKKTEYTENLALVQEGSEAQKAYAAAVAEAVKAKQAYLDARYAADLVDEAIDVIGIEYFNADKSVGSYIPNGEYGLAKGLYDDAINVDEAILACEQAIANAKATIAAGSVGGYYETQQVWAYVPSTGNWEYVDAQIWIPEEKVNLTLEQLQAMYQAEIDRIKAEIEVQQALADSYKAELDALLGTGSTSSEEQPAA